MYVNSTQLQHASLDTAVQVELVMVMVIMKMMRRVVNQWCSDAVRRPGSDDDYDYDCDDAGQSSQGSSDFDNYDDGDTRLIEQNMAFPS